jgi:hypothetical protein
MTDHNGVWLDVDSGAVGFDKPKRAKLLVSPGRKIPDEVAERMDAKKAPAKKAVRREEGRGREAD